MPSLPIPLKARAFHLWKAGASGTERHRTMNSSHLRSKNSKRKRGIAMGEKIATRHAYGEALAEVGAENHDIVVLDADVSTCTMSCMFGEKFPDRFST